MLSVLGCLAVFVLLLGVVLGCGVLLGVLLHWLVPAIDLGIGTLSGLVAIGVALWTFGRLMALLPESWETEEEPPPVWQLRPLPRAPRAARRPRKRS